MKNKNEVAVFGGGCFWCTEAVFTRLKGVTSVVSGYAGGKTHNPTYEDVAYNDTGHAEVIQIEFDPSVISYETLLEVFFSTHDPTTLNRQAYDKGTEYRSIILYTSEEQRETANKVIQKLVNDNVFASPILTEVKVLEKFYLAESYHQDYYNKNSYMPYCQIIINPKLEHLKKKYQSLLK